MIEVNDTYEAAYYYISGGKLVSARTTNVPENKQNKLGYRTKWHITMDNVDPVFIEYWKTSRAVANVRQIAVVRKKIKSFVRKYV